LETSSAYRPQSVSRSFLFLCTDASVSAAAASNSTTSEAGPDVQKLQATRGKYKAYTVKEKKLIVEEAREHGARPTAARYCIARATLMGWMKTDFKNVQSCKKGARSAGGGRKLRIGCDKDEEILKWIMEQRDQNVPVSREAIQEHAKTKCAESHPDFTASSGWLQKFMRRHQLSLRSRTSLSQRLPADLEDKVASFTTFVKDLRSEDDFDDEFIINMDETPVFFDLIPNKTVEKQGSKSVIVRSSGSEKRHVTVILAIAADGAVLPTMIIFKGKRALKNIKVPDGCIVAVQQKAWCDEAIMIRWINECLKVYTNRQRSLVVLDSFRCHIMDSIKKQLRKANAELAVIPGGCTSILQPLDVSVNKPFKGWLRASWTEYIRNDAARVDAARKAGEAAAKIQPPSKQLIVDWVGSAVMKLREKSDLVRKSFVVTGIAPALNGADDHLVRKANDDSEDDSDEEFWGFSSADLREGPSVASDLSDSDSDTE